jgi:hypothetical protein
MVHDEEDVKEFLALDHDSLMERLGEDIMSESGMDFADSQSRSSVITTGMAWWDGYRTEKLCPLIQSTPALKRAVYHKIGFPQVNHTLTIVALLTTVSPGLSHIRALGAC